DDTPQLVASVPLMLFRDPPEHTRLRAAVPPWLTPRGVGRLRGLVTTVVDATLDGLPDGAFDLLAEFAYLVPVAVMASLLDVGAEGADLFLQRTPALARLL